MRKWLLPSEAAHKLVAASNRCEFRRLLTPEVTRLQADTFDPCCCGIVRQGIVKIEHDGDDVLGCRLGVHRRMEAAGYDRD